METLLFCIMTKAALSKMYEWTEMNERGGCGEGSGRGQLKGFWRNASEWVKHVNI